MNFQTLPFFLLGLSQGLPSFEVEKKNTIKLLPTIFYRGFILINFHNFLTFDFLS